MLAALPWNELAYLIPALAVGGILTGLLGGLFGVGGGGIMVPILYEVFGAMGVDDAYRMQLCVATSLAVIVPTSYTSYRAHKAKGAVIPGILKTWAVPATVGILLGTALAAVVKGWVLQVAFVLIIGTLGLKSVVGRNDLTLSDHLPGKVGMAAYGLFIGFASALVGVSGGGLGTNILLLYGVPIHAAVATSAGIGMIVPIPGVIGYIVGGWRHMDALPPLSLGFVSVLGFVILAPLAAYVAPYGARLAHRLSRRKLEIAFGCFFLFVAARVLVALIWHGSHAPGA